MEYYKLIKKDNTELYVTYKEIIDGYSSLGSYFTKLLKEMRVGEEMNHDSTMATMIKVSEKEYNKKKKNPNG